MTWGKYLLSHKVTIPGVAGRREWLSPKPTYCLPQEVILTMEMEVNVSNRGNKSMIHLSYMQWIVVTFKLKYYNIFIYSIFPMRTIPRNLLNICHILKNELRCKLRILTKLKLYRYGQLCPIFHSRPILGSIIIVILQSVGFLTPFHCIHFMELQNKNLHVISSKDIELSLDSQWLISCIKLTGLSEAQIKHFFLGVSVKVFLKDVNIWTGILSKEHPHQCKWVSLIHWDPR